MGNGVIPYHKLNIHSGKNINEDDQTKIVSGIKRLQVNQNTRSLELSHIN
jgi:hypothetical protein